MEKVISTSHTLNAQVKGHGAQTQLQWDLKFTIKDESLFDVVKQAVEGMYTAGATGLESISKN